MEKPVLLLTISLLLISCTKGNENYHPSSSECDLAEIKISFQSIVDSLETEHGELASAIARLNTANEVARACSQNALDSIQALANDKLGGYLLGQQELSIARKYFQIALQLRKKMFQSTPHRDILRMYHNIGLCYSWEGDQHSALTYFDSADVWIPEVMPRPFVDTKIRIGQSYLALGEYNNALHSFQIGLDSMNLYPDFPMAIRLELVRSMISCYRLLHKFDIAIKVGEQEVRHVNKSSNLPSMEMADLYLEMGNTWQDSLLLNLTNKEVKQKAIFYTRKALNIYEEIQDEVRMSIAAGNLGELFRRTGQFKEAKKVLTKAIQRLEQSDLDQKWKSILYPQLYINRGETHFGKDDYSMALNDYDTSMHFIMPAYQLGPDEPMPPLSSYIGNRRDLMVCLSDIAQTYSTIYQKDNEQPRALEKSQAVYDSLFILFNLIRGDFISDQAKLELAASSQDALDKAFSVCKQLGREYPEKQSRYDQQAFRISEQSKAFVLLEGARLNNASGSLPVSWRQEEIALLKERAEIEEALFQTQTENNQSGELRLALQDNFDAIRAFQHKLKKEFHQVYAVKYQGVDLPIENIQTKLLEQDQALIEYFIQDSALHIFLIKPGVFLRKEILIARADLEKWVKSFRKMLEQGPLMNEEQEGQFIKSAGQLYQFLLQPVEPLLSERLIIIPAGVLNNLPFEALLHTTSEGNLEKQSMDENFVLFRHAVNYCFSTSLLEVMQATARPVSLKKGMAVFGCKFNPDLNGKKNLLAFPPALQNAILSLKPLKNQDSEMSGILEIISGATPFSGPDANQNNFKEACRRFPIVHVSTHGILNEDDPGFSFISFSQMGSEPDISELLFVKELYASRDWNVDLVFFSACQTASGRYFAGEGNISMASGLAHAGVRSFVTTFWNVPTYPIAEMAPVFYKNYLIDGRPKDIALAIAKRTIAKRSSPYDWAGLILIGTTR